MAPIMLAGYKPGWFRLFFSGTDLPALFHCCPPGADTIGRHTPVTYAVLPAYYTVVLWRRDNRPSHASYLCSFAGILHRCTLTPGYSAVTRQVPMQFCRHITPFYSGAG